MSTHLRRSPTGASSRAEQRVVCRRRAPASFEDDLDAKRLDRAPEEVRKPEGLATHRLLECSERCGFDLLTPVEFADMSSA